MRQNGVARTRPRLELAKFLRVCPSPVTHQPGVGSKIKRFWNGPQGTDLQAQVPSRRAQQRRSRSRPAMWCSEVHRVPVSGVVLDRALSRLGVATSFAVAVFYVASSTACGCLPALAIAQHNSALLVIRWSASRRPSSVIWTKTLRRRCHGVAGHPDWASDIPAVHFRVPGTPRPTTATRSASYDLTWLTILDSRVA